MITIHPNILERDGNKAFVVLPYEQFAMIHQELKELRAAKAQEADAPTVPLRDAKNELAL